MDATVHTPAVSPDPAGNDDTPDVGAAGLGDLLDRAAQGDVAAAAAVYDQVSAPAYRLVRLAVGEPELAAQICRQGFSHVWDNWTATVTAHGRPASPQLWILTVMYHLATAHAGRAGSVAYDAASHHYDTVWPCSGFLLRSSHMN